MIKKKKKLSIFHAHVQFHVPKVPKKLDSLITISSQFPDPNDKLTMIK